MLSLLRCKNFNENIQNIQNELQVWKRQALMTEKLLIELMSNFTYIHPPTASYFTGSPVFSPISSITLGQQIYFLNSYIKRNCQMRLLLSSNSILSSFTSSSLSFSLPSSLIDIIVAYDVPIILKSAFIDSDPLMASSGLLGNADFLRDNDILQKLLIDQDFINSIDNDELIILNSRMKQREDEYLRKAFGYLYKREAEVEKYIQQYEKYLQEQEQDQERERERIEIKSSQL
jgi:hypothetical protein